MSGELRGKMPKPNEESWIDRGLIGGLLMRYILRRKDNGFSFIAQLEYANKPILRWDDAHKYFHLDVYKPNAEKPIKEKYYPLVKSLNKQVDVVFKELKDNLELILEKHEYLELKRRVLKEKSSFQRHLKEVETEVESQIPDLRTLNLGSIHHGESIKAKANINDSLEIELRDQNGNLINYQSLSP